MWRNNCYDFMSIVSMYYVEQMFAEVEMGLGCIFVQYQFIPQDGVVK